MQGKNRCIYRKIAWDLHNWMIKYLVKEDTITIFYRQDDEGGPLEHVQIVENGKIG